MNKGTSGFLFLLLWGCGEDGTLCDTTATLEDYTGFDGCGFVLVLEDGQVLEMGGFDEEPDFTFKGGMKVGISYTEMTEMVSICMVGLIVRVTCMEKR
ncbi:MAG: hypothetical protein CMG71_03110 [Candidatus Marinimicrobia bacterium]|nr:hypothetical protein [Candidatus Neomarinimicrobiota bacterium]|tara:strand:+ start:4071 stop:4364 length:294 start_codon:yes stop_codon:yes gene_type:complete